MLWYKLKNSYCCNPTCSIWILATSAVKYRLSCWHLYRNLQGSSRVLFLKKKKTSRIGAITLRFQFQHFFGSIGGISDVGIRISLRPSIKHTKFRSFYNTPCYQLPHDYKSTLPTETWFVRERHDHLGRLSRTSDLSDNLGRYRSMTVLSLLFPLQGGWGRSAYIWVSPPHVD